jgi:hypothetical protein
MKSYKFTLNKVILSAFISAMIILLACDAEVEVDKTFEEILASQPTITSFSPEVSPVLSTATIIGTNLNFVDKAYINNIETPIKQKINANQLIIEIGENVTSGLIKLVTTANKEAVSSNPIIISYLVPSITSNIPKFSKVNEDIILEGKNINSISKILFGGKEGIIQFRDQNSVVVKTPANFDSPMVLSVIYKSDTGDKTLNLESNYSVIIPLPEITRITKVLSKNNKGFIVGKNLNLIEKIKYSDKTVIIEDISDSSITFKLPENTLITGKYNLVLEYASGTKNITKTDVPYINGDFLDLFDYDDYGIDLISLKNDIAGFTVTHKYETDPSLQPPFPAGSTAFYSVEFNGLTSSNISENKIHENSVNKGELGTILNGTRFNGTPYLHFWYKSTERSGVKISLRKNGASVKRELTSNYRSTAGVWKLIAVNLKDFITDVNLADQFTIQLTPTTANPTNKVSNVDWFIITDKVLTEFNAEEYPVGATVTHWSAN